MSNEPAPLDPALSALLDAERDPPSNALARRRVLSRVEKTLDLGGSGGGGASSGAAASGIGAKLVILFTGIAVVVGAIVWSQRRADSPPEPPVVIVPAEQSATSPSGEAPATLPEPGAVLAPSTAAATALVPAPKPADNPVAAVVSPSGSPAGATAEPDTATVEAANPAPAARRDPAAERALLERARRRLAAHDPAAALGPLGIHRRTFPRGALVEERESLWIKALVDQGDAAAATRRAARFRRRYPNSIHLPAIDSLIGNAP